MSFEGNEIAEKAINIFLNIFLYFSYILYIAFSTQISICVIFVLLSFGVHCYQLTIIFCALPALDRICSLCKNMLQVKYLTELVSYFIICIFFIYCSFVAISGYFSATSLILYGIISFFTMWIYLMNYQETKQSWFLIYMSILFFCGSIFIGFTVCDFIRGNSSALSLIDGSLLGRIFIIIVTVLLIFFYYHFYFIFQKEKIVNGKPDRAFLNNKILNILEQVIKKIFLSFIFVFSFVTRILTSMLATLIVFMLLNFGIFFYQVTIISFVWLTFISLIFLCSEIFDFKRLGCGIGRSLLLVLACFLNLICVFSSTIMVCISGHFSNTSIILYGIVLLVNSWICMIKYEKTKQSEYLTGIPIYFFCGFIFIGFTVYDFIIGNRSALSLIDGTLSGSIFLIIFIVFISIRLFFYDTKNLQDKLKKNPNSYINYKL